MTDEIEKTDAKTGGTPPEEEKRFTQADLDALITKRLAEERSRRVTVRRRRRRRRSRSRQRSPSSRGRSASVRSMKRS